MTAKKYVDYLRQAFLVQLLTKHSFKSKERIRNSKAYIVDPGLQNNRDNAVELIQVAYDIDNEKTFKRETSALVNASSSLRCDRLTLIAFSPTRDVEVNGKSIHVVSAIEWLTD